MSETRRRKNLSRTAWRTAALALLSILGTAAPGASGAGGISPDFTYQGQLSVSGTPATGTFDLRFEAWDVGSGLQLGPTVVKQDVAVEAGLFAVTLDFGFVFLGGEVDLEIGVRDGTSGGAFTTLSPRQRITASPNALYARTAAWDGLVDLPAGFADDTDDDTLEELACVGNRLVVADGNGWRCGGEAQISTGDNLAGGSAPEAGQAAVALRLYAQGPQETALEAYGTTRGGYFEATGEAATGVYGRAVDPGGDGVGVHGASDGIGVYGRALGASGLKYAVVGLTESPHGYAGYFHGGKIYLGGPVGVGLYNYTAQVPLHLQVSNLSLDSAELAASLEDMAVEATDAAIGLYSSNDNGWGSRLSLATVDSFGDLIDKWSLIRVNPGSSYGPDLRFTYGPDPYAGNNATQMTIGSDGRVGIGTISPSFLLHVDGDAGKPGGGSWSTASDARLKRDIAPLEGALEALGALRGVTFEYVDAEAIDELPGPRIGMLAQEVAAVFPDWVSTGADGYLRLTFRGFEALTVEALRELRAEKDAEIAALERRLAALEARLSALAAARISERAP